MDWESDSAKFKKWAMDLGCPMENMPSEECLKRIFRSNQNQKMFDMMRKIRPRNEVKHIRDNIINKNIRKVDGRINTLMLSSLPTALQRYTHLENLKAKIDVTQNSLKQAKFQIENVSKSIENENRDYVQTKQNFDLSIQRIYVTENKIDSFIKYLKSLKEKKMNIDSVLIYNKQVIGNDSDHHSANDKSLINQCIEYLYDNNMERYDQSTINHLKQTLNSIRNINKWNLISTIANEQTQLIKNLSDKPKFKNEDFRYTILLSKLYAAHVKTIFKLKKIAVDCDHFNNLLESQVRNTDEIITKKFEMFNSSILSLNQNINCNEFLLNFIESIITKYIQNEQKTYLNLQIDIIHNEINQYENVDIENQKLIQTFDLIYNNIMGSIDNIKKNSIIIGSTNGKLEYLKKGCDYLMNEIFKNNTLKKGKLSNNNFRKILNDKYLTTMAMESFYDESLLCSTKIGYDFENTSRMESTVLPINQNIQYNFIQSQLAEFQLFNKLPFMRNSYLPSKFNIFIVSNHILNQSTNEVYKQMFRNHLNTGNGVLDYVDKKLELFDLLKCSASKRIDLEIPSDEKLYVGVNKKEIQSKLDIQKENLEIIISHIDGLLTNMKLNFDQNNVVMKVLLRNEFKEYIPSSEKLNGHSYKQLENELKIISRMYQNA